MAQRFSSFSQFRAALSSAPTIDASALQGAQERNGQLTKPPGALGRLEDLAQWYAGWRGNPRPSIDAPQIVIFAGNHGVTAQGVSAFPAEVTEQMVFNFQAGGAAINQLAKQNNAKLDVHALDLDRPTNDFSQGPAMSEEETCAALSAGWDAVDPASDLLVVGEMGIGNTTAGAALAMAVFGGEGADWCGAGTGVDAEGIALKARVVDAGLAANPTAKDSGLDALAGVGGREIAAMAGAIAGARANRIPVILDGFIATSAAATLWAEDKDGLAHVVAGHTSAEQAHVRMLDGMQLEPLLSLGLRLGEGSGAAVAISILKSAIACHSGMATFAEAGVSEG